MNSKKVLKKVSKTFKKIAKTIKEKVKTAKNSALRPWVNKIMVVREPTKAECVLGIPPVTVQSLKRNFCLNLNINIKIFTNCESTLATTIDQNILFVNSSVCLETI